MEDSLSLEIPFEDEKVKDVLWQCQNDKSPSPNGFNMDFFKAYWYILEVDVLNFVRHFFFNSKVPRAVTTSFLTLIPKHDNPQSSGEYIHICVITSLYRILSKLLASRLKKVLDGLISNCQLTFLSGRQIQDEVLVVNETVDYATRNKKKCLVVKVDFKRLTLCFVGLLRYMMKRLNFGLRWLLHMEILVFTNTMSILVNESPTSEFQVEKVLRQGDPLSPYIFLLVAQGLSDLMFQASRIGDFKGFNFKWDVKFEILQFYDDAVLFCDGAWSNLWSIKVMLRGFEVVSGLNINLS